MNTVWERENPSPIMKLLGVVCLLYVLLLHGADGSWWSHEPECEFTRDDALQCIRRFVDTNHDDKISLDELEAARSKYMTGFQKAGAWVASWFTDDFSNETILRNCDYDKDGVFTPHDFEQATEKCLPDQHALCLLKGACDKAAAAASKEGSR